MDSCCLRSCILQLELVLETADKKMRKGGGGGEGACPSVPVVLQRMIHMEEDERQEVLKSHHHGADANDGGDDDKSGDGNILHYFHLHSKKRDGAGDEAYALPGFSDLHIRVCVNDHGLLLDY